MFVVINDCNEGEIYAVKSNIEGIDENTIMEFALNSDEQQFVCLTNEVNKGIEQTYLSRYPIWLVSKPKLDQKIIDKLILTWIQEDTDDKNDLYEMAEEFMAKKNLKKIGIVDAVEINNRTTQLVGEQEKIDEFVKKFDLYVTQELEEDCDATLEV